MSSAPPQVVQIACPNCGNPIRAQVFTLVDVGQQPELKSYLLSGQLNLVICPNCGFTSMLGAPLVYHDPAKQLFLVHFPQQLNAGPEEQERFIGDAASIIMRSLPENAPRGYLLAPRRFLTLNSLIETVLEADGITKEMLEAQRRRVDLIGQLADAMEQGDEQLQPLVDEHRAELDEEFFTTLGAFVEASARSGQEESASILGTLRDRLIELTGYSPEGGEEAEVSIEEAADRLAAAGDDELEQLIADLRPALDYEFFEEWTARIEAAEQAGDSATAERLTARRQIILETTERLDQEARALFEQASALLEQALKADDPAAVLREHNAEIDDAFMLVLEANRAAAERVGAAEMLTKLDEIRELAVQVVEESLPPEDRLINQLMQAPTPQEASTLLRSNRAMVNAPFVKRMNELADEFQQNGRAPESERLRQLAREAGAMLF